MTAPYTPMPPPHQMHTSVEPLSVYPPQHPNFDSSYRMVHHTPPGSLFATGPSGSGHHADDESEEDDDEVDALVRRNPPRNRRAPNCGTEDIGDISEGRGLHDLLKVRIGYPAMAEPNSLFKMSEVPDMSELAIHVKRIS
ncbi:hypothetical protein V6N13_071463 [Hibiscus sabdariffa]